MTAAHQLQQRYGQRRVGEPIAAANAAHAIVDHDQFQIAGSSSLRHGRGSKARPNCRGVTASALSFTPRSLDLDAQTAIRVRLAAGLLPEQAAALVLNTGHHVLQDTADVPETIHVETLSSAADCHDHQSDSDRGRKIGKPFQLNE